MTAKERNILLDALESIDSMRNFHEGIILMCSGEKKIKAESYCDGLNYADRLIKKLLNK